MFKFQEEKMTNRSTPKIIDPLQNLRQEVDRAELEARLVEAKVRLLQATATIKELSPKKGARAL